MLSAKLGGWAMPGLPSQGILPVKIASVLHGHRIAAPPDNHNVSHTMIICGQGFIHPGFQRLNPSLPVSAIDRDDHFCVRPALGTRKR